MVRRVMTSAIAIVGGVIICQRAGAADLSVPVSIGESAGVARQGEPAWGGVPFRKGQVKDVAGLVLVDKSGKPVPAQFTRLAGYEDGSVQWALVDLVTDLPAGGKAEYTVKAKQAGVTEVTRPIKIQETADSVTIDTGPLQALVGKRKFTLLEAVTPDGRELGGPGEIALTDAEGKSFQAGPPTKIAWEYRGPVRVTIRLDGAYVDGTGKPWIFYTTRITAWAGLSLLRIDHSIRNSDPTAGFDAKIRQATVSLKLDGKAGQTGKGPDWVAADGLLVATRHSGGCFPGGSAYSATPSQTLYRQEIADGAATVYLIPPADTEPAGKRGALFGYDKAGGFFALGDCAHKDTEIWLDFHQVQRDPAANQARAKALRCPLHVLPDGAWISETETLGTGKFGTLADEIDTYRKWGWKGWDNEKKQPKMAHQPDAYVAKEVIHYESETDSAEGYVLMYVRTGQRGYLDWARAWAEFGKTHYAYRTDGFAFGASRPSTGLKIGWYGPKEYGWSDSRSEYCHFYARGIFDYYCLTGDVDALEAGRDLVEQTAAWSGKNKPGSAIGYYGCRGFARMWLAPIRLAQLTRDPADRKLADQLAEIVLKASDWDERGFIFWGAGPQYMAEHQFADKNIPAKVKEYMAANRITIDKKGMVTDKAGSTWPLRSDGGTWQQTTLQMALERYWRLSGSEQAKAKAVKMADFARDYQMSRKCRQAFYYTILDFPEKNRVYDMADFDDSHANCPVEGAAHDGHYTRFFPDVFARACSLTGDKTWLDHARGAWNYGSKRGYRATKQSAADDEVFIFAYHNAPKDDTVLSTARMFYEVPRAK